MLKRAQVEFMVRKVGLENLCIDAGMKIIRTRLSEIDFSNINYNFSLMTATATSRAKRMQA